MSSFTDGEDIQEPDDRPPNLNVPNNPTLAHADFTPSFTQPQRIIIRPEDFPRSAGRSSSRDGHNALLLLAPKILSHTNCRVDQVGDADTMSSYATSIVTKEDAWEWVKPDFVQLWLDEDLPLVEVRRRLSTDYFREYSFEASINMYKKRINKWGLKKYTTGSRRSQATASSSSHFGRQPGRLRPILPAPSEDVLRDVGNQFDAVRPYPDHTSAIYTDQFSLPGATDGTVDPSLLTLPGLEQTSQLYNAQRYHHTMREYTSQLIAHIRGIDISAESQRDIERHSYQGLGQGRARLNLDRWEGSTAWYHRLND